MNNATTRYLGGVVVLGLGTLVLLAGLVPRFGVPSMVYVPATVAVFVGALLIGISKRGALV